MRYRVAYLQTANHRKALLLLKRLLQYNVCIGNPDDDFQELVPVGCGITDKETAGIMGYKEGDFCASFGDFVYHSTIRSVSCDLLVNGNRCKSCKLHRKSLKATKQRMEERNNETRDFVHSTYKHKDMTKEMLVKKVYQQKDEIQSLESEISKLKRQYKNEILENGICLDNVQSMEIKDLMSTCHNDMVSAFPDGNSFQRLFWEQQLQFERSGKNGMRWHPMIISWCLFFKTEVIKCL